MAEKVFRRKATDNLGTVWNSAEIHNRRYDGKRVVRA
jgi:hypothetical protein